ncbi:MAG: cytochrome c-type biogenesis protein CcmH [Chloroflexota bacterium]|nr:MAG: cytochrome c-type biogenesis protein CcmH [Chloroflexota bacterium]
MHQLTKLPRLLSITILVVIMLVVALPALAQEGTQPVSDDQVNEVAKELYCPICESTPLDVCATQACADWREVIRTKLAEGQTGQEIKDYFELQYGPQALAEPPQSGFTLAVWILPVLAVVVGGFVFARYVRGLRAAAATPDGGVPETEPPAPEAPPQGDAPEGDTSRGVDYRTRIESELREM